jgi:hypothetical protein
MKEAEITHFSAYLIADDTDDLQVKMFAVASNAREGTRTAREARVAQGLWLMNTYGLTAQKASETVNVAPKLLTRHRAIQETKLRIASLPTVKPEYLKRLGETVVERLSSIRSDETLASAVNVIGRYELTTEEANRLVPAVNRAKSEKDAEEFLAQKGEEYKHLVVATPKGPARTPQSAKIRSLRTALGTIRNAISKPFMSLRKPDRTAFAADLRRTASHCTALAKEIDK